MAQPTRVAINGFGRIGRMALRAARGHDSFEVVAINDLTDTKTLAHLLQYDTSSGRFQSQVDFDENHLIVDGNHIPVTAEKDPSILPWKELEVEVVLECTGFFTDEEGARKHLEAGARRVIMSAPPKGNGIPTYMIGVNEHTYDGAPVISNASCTTNCIATVADILHREVGIVKSLMTTVHSYTADQNLQDGPHKDLRRARAAAENIVPTSTGAAVSVTEIITDLRERFDGVSYRVPTPVGSIAEVNALLHRKVTVEELNNIFIQASKDPKRSHVLEVASSPLVSSDIVGNPHSAIFDPELTQVVDGDLVRVVAWYDNEWGYSNRLVEMIGVVAKTL